MPEDLVKNAGENLSNPERNNVEFNEMLKTLVAETIKFNQYQSRLIKEYLEKRVLTGKYSFRFPFILREENITSFSEHINRRLKEKYEENYDLKFHAIADFRSDDQFVYKSTKELFEANHDEAMRRIYLSWEYTVYEEIDGLTVPVPYDIIIVYEVEQDSDHREWFKIEEFGAIQVQGSDNDWINGTLKQLKNLTESTKMPFWWYYPKKAFLELREYKNILIYGFAFLLSAILYSRFSSNQSNLDFIQEVSQLKDASEKLQAYIEYSLTVHNSSLWTWVLLFLTPAIFTTCITKVSRFIFPQSMIMIGCAKSKLNNRWKAYNFIWAAVLTSIIGIVLVAALRT